jgi:uncharacterized iron-regulated membrane protein
MTWLHPLVLLHRYVGLVMAGFLLLAGLTGAVLAYYHELDGAMNPAWSHVAPPRPDALPLDALQLREQVQQRHPQARVNFVPLAQRPGEPAVFFLTAGRDPATGQPALLANDQVFVDPYTGRILGERRWGDLAQGWTNLLPFIYRLHYQVALGTVGTYVFGVIAVLWTLDCFVGFVLTFPVGRASRQTARSAPAGRGWWSRWWQAWQLRWGHGAYRLNFDLHRAGGLWLWAWMFVFAWSSVALNLHDVYHPVMHALFESQEDDAGKPASSPPTAKAALPPTDWPAARAQGRLLMAGLGQAKGFAVQREDRITYRAHRNEYQYRVLSDRDIRGRRGVTSVDFDGSTGTLLRSYVPTGEASGDTVTTWLLALHMADVWGRPFQAFVFFLGVATCVLSGTGVWIWWRKRKGRRAGRRLSVA